MAKRPSSQYYWGDWHRDLALQSCPLAARGLWHEMNCLMHQGEPYGHLTMPNGNGMSVAQLANLAKITERECKKLLAFLEDACVFSRTDEGIIYSRRMVRDEELRNARAEGGKNGADHGAKGAEHGKKGGRPKKDNGGSKTPLNESDKGGFETGQKPPPSSSSSSSSALPNNNLSGSGGVITPNRASGPPPPAAGFGQRGTRITPDWQPRPRTVEALVAPISGNVPAQFVQEQIPQFVAYWLDSQQCRESWDALFRTQTLDRWKKTGHEWVPMPAPPVQRQSAFDALTDRSWAAGLVDETAGPPDNPPALIGRGGDR